MRFGRWILGVCVVCVVTVGVIGWSYVGAPPVSAQAVGSFRTGSLTANTQSICLDTSNAGSAAIQLSGTWSATVTFQGSVDGANFVSLNMVPSSSATATTTASSNGAWNANVGGYRQVCATTTAFSSGTVAVAIGSAASGGK